MAVTKVIVMGQIVLSLLEHSVIFTKDPARTAGALVHTHDTYTSYVPNYFIANPHRHKHTYTIMCKLTKL